VSAGNAREAVLRVADQLCAELGFDEVASELARGRGPLSGDGIGMLEILDPEDESLVVMIRDALAKVAAALGAGKPDGDAGRAVCAALDGAEMVLRGELVSGNFKRLPALMPSFVFLVTLPIVDQEEALELSRRTSELIEVELSS
jgi:hypothetical protein